MKKWIAVAAAALILLGLCACNTAAKFQTTISPANLTEQEEKIAALLAANTQYSIFDFSVDDSFKSVHINRYRLENGSWVSAGGSGHTLDGTSGRIALLTDGNSKQSRIVLQSKSSSGSAAYDMPEDLYVEGMSSAASYLSHVEEIILDKEIPLQVQTFTTQDSFSSYDVSTFNQPGVLAQKGYAQVYAVTVIFSQSKLS